MSRLRFRYTWVNIEGEELDDTKRALAFHNVNRCAWDDVFRIAYCEYMPCAHTFRVLAVEEVTP